MHKVGPWPAYVGLFGRCQVPSRCDRRTRHEAARHSREKHPVLDTTGETLRVSGQVRGRWPLPPAEAAAQPPAEAMGGLMM